MKIELFTLNGSFAHSSLAIRCLKTALTDAGFSSVHCTEGTLRDRTEALLAELVEANADLYSFSCYIWNVTAILSLARDLKTVHPKATVVLGGPEVSFDTERFTALDFVNTVITGEGEEAIVTVANAVREGKALPPVLHGTPDRGFAARGIHYEKSAPVPSLVYYEGSRGCPFSCTFCLSSAEEGVRAKSAEKVLLDLLEFESFEGPITVKLVDRTFNFDRERAKKIWRGLLFPAYTKCYHFEIAAHLLDEEAFEILGKFPAGKVRLEIGLQSTNEKTLDAVCRHAGTAATLAAAARLKAMGSCHVHLDLIAGLPFEDYRTFAASFDAAYPVCDVLQLGFLKLLHGTALRRDAEKYGIRASQAPPYTVLETPWLSFAELHRLHGISDILDRLCEKGRFVHTLHFILPHSPSFFTFFEGILDYLKSEGDKSVQQLSQRALFSVVWNYGKTLVPQDLHDEFRRHLFADFSAVETRRPPKFL
ncbi:MAG: DUF4080 domain-containing protein [Clostridia bacterium]|nr:DUF4080 domain-containing protein [Clostridia bacterium]